MTAARRRPESAARVRRARHVHGHADGRRRHRDPTARWWRVPSRCRADTTVTAAADAHVRSDRPDRNYGTVDHVRIRQASTEYRGLVRFDVAAIPSTVTSATVRMFVDDASPSAGDLFLGRQRLGRDHGVNWSNQPALGPIPGRVRWSRSRGNLARVGRHERTVGRGRRLLLVHRRQFERQQRLLLESRRVRTHRSS